MLNRGLTRGNLLVLKKFFSHPRVYVQTSAQPVELDRDVAIRRPLPRALDKKPTRSPFMKSLFLGRFDSEAIGYLDAQTKERYFEFNKWLKSVEDCVKSVDLLEVEKTKTIPKNCLLQLAELGVFGARISEEYKGQNLLSSEFVKLLEVLGDVPGLGHFIFKQGTSPIDLVSNHGSAEQKLELLTKCASGDSIIALALSETENLGPAQRHFNTSALLSKDQKHWNLNGTKRLVSNADYCDTILVVGYARRSGALDHKPEMLTTFIVNKNLPGVQISEPTPMLGLPGFHTCTVNFKDVLVSYNNVLGQVGDGNKHISESFANSKHFIAAQIISLLRRIMGVLTDVALETHKEKAIISYESVHFVISEITRTIYAIESMLYLTTGLQDTYKDQDIQLEAALTEIWSITECLNRVSECANILGIQSCMIEKPYKQFMLDTYTLTNYDSSVMDTKNFAGLSGLQHFGTEMATVINELRNPFMYPSLLKKMFQKDQLQLGVANHLHPSLVVCAEYLDKAIFKLKKGSELLLTRFGFEISERHMEIHKISDMAMSIFAYMAILGRASRSFCLDNENSENELKLSVVMSHNIFQKVDNMFMDIEHSEYGNGDYLSKNLSQVHFQQKKYFAEHPLKRNY